MELNEEQNIERLTRETDPPDRLNKQSALAIIGSLILSSTLWYSGWQESQVLVALVGLSLVVTPGLAIDGLVYGALRRPVGSVVGNMVIAGLAWYSGTISLGFALDYPFNIDTISGLTLVFSLMAVVASLFAGGIRVSQLFGQNDFKNLAAFAMSLVLLSSIVGGAAYISLNKNILQPTGNRDSMSLALPNGFGQDSPYVLNGATGWIGLNLVSQERSHHLLVEFISEDGTTNSIFSSVSDTNSVISIPTPEVAGCGHINITNLTTKQFIHNLYVKDFVSTQCRIVIIADIFEKFEIDSGGAPTSSLKDLLKFAEDQSAKGDLDKLPRAFKDCIKQEDPALMVDCLDSQ